MCGGTGTKKIKIEVKSAVRDGFRERGWRAVRWDSSTFQAPESLVAAPLALRVPVTIEPYKYGGATLTANAVVQCDAVTDVLVGFDRQSMPSQFSRFPGEGASRRLLDVGLTTAGGLLDPMGNYHQWVVDELDDVQSRTADLFVMVDGPLAAWVAERDTPAKVPGWWQDQLAG